MDSAVGFLQNAADCNASALGQSVIEKSLDSGEILRIDDLGNAFLLDSTVVRLQVLLDLGLKFFGQAVFLLLLD